MNYHSRSFSEQPQMAQASGAPGAGANGTSGGPQPQSFIRIHSDSQQSLDQLFNPSTQNTVPLRNRNLPLSFFNPSVKNDILESSAPGNGAPRVTNLHHRSVSFDHQNQSAAAAAAANNDGANVHIIRSRPQNSFHMRTHSTLAPMPRLLSNNSSHQSSHEFVNQEVSSTQEPATFVSDTSNHLNGQQNLHHHSHSTSGWSSAANSTDNLSSPSWAASQPSLAARDLPNGPMATHQQQQHHHHNHHNHHHHPIHAQQDGAATMMQQQQQQPIMSPAHSHQNVFYNGNSNTGTNGTNGTAQTAMAPQPAANTHACANNLHSRSMSFNPNPSAEMHVNQHHGFHARTHSTVAHMSSASMAPCNQHASLGNHSLHGSSQELNYQSNTINTSSAAGWSSSGYSTDDMTAGSGHNWAVAGQQQHHQHHLQQQQQQQQQPTVAQPNLHQAAPMHTMKPAMQTQLHNHHHPHDHHLHHHHHHMQAQAQHQQTHQPQQQLFYHV